MNFDEQMFHFFIRLETEEVQDDFTLNNDRFDWHLPSLEKRLSLGFPLVHNSDVVVIEAVRLIRCGQLFGQLFEHSTSEFVCRDRRLQSTVLLQQYFEAKPPDSTITILLKVVL